MSESLQAVTEKEAKVNSVIFIIAASIFVISLFASIILSKSIKKEHDTVIYPQIHEHMRNINSLENGIKTFKSENSYVLDFLPETYRNASAVSFMFLAISNGRADTLKEAMNLYEEQLHRWKLEAYARQSAETQEYCARAMNELNSKQAKANEHLKNIEFMQFINYYSN